MENQDKIDIEKNRVEQARFTSQLVTMGATALGAILYCKPESFPKALESFSRNYACDVTLPFGAYFFLREVFDLGRTTALALSIVPPCLLEVAQGLGLYKGTYDSKDFLAYTGGALVSLAANELIHKVFRRKNKSLDTRLVEPIV